MNSGTSFFYPLTNKLLDFVWLLSFLRFIFLFFFVISMYSENCHFAPTLHLADQIKSFISNKCILIMSGQKHHFIYTNDKKFFIIIMFFLHLMHCTKGFRQLSPFCAIWMRLFANQMSRITYFKWDILTSQLFSLFWIFPEFDLFQKTFHLLTSYVNIVLSTWLSVVWQHTNFNEKSTRWPFSWQMVKKKHICAEKYKINGHVKILLFRRIPIKTLLSLRNKR